MRSSRGQLWSLDVVLAGVLFTLAVGLILSQTELNVFSSQQERNMRELQTVALMASNALTSQADLSVSPFGSPENIRCGPNFQTTLSSPIPRGWSYDYDLSWMENCFIDRAAVLTPASLGMPAGFGVQVSIPSGGAPLLLSTATPPVNVPIARVTRKMLIFPSHVGAVEFRQCLDGGCANKLVDVTVSVWRT